MKKTQNLRIWLAVGLAVALVAVVYFGRGGPLPTDSGGGPPSAEEQGDAGARTAARSPRAPTVAPPTVSQAGSATVPTSGESSLRGYDLGPDETKGGHALSRHVGKTDAELAVRLKAEPGISAASTYNDRAAAETTVARAFERNATKVDAWRARKGERPNLVLDIDMPSPIGRTLRRGERAADADSAIVVLKWDGKGGFVLTSYPQER